MDPGRFYDDLAECYDLIYEDWERSMARQGRAISEMLASAVSLPPASTRILDVAAGIGTQSLALASLGFDVTARDLPSCAISRLQREAAARSLDIDAGPADMRCVSQSVEAPFDAVMAFDNSLPHLLNDDELGEALREFRSVLRPHGVLLVSVRDYEATDRAARSEHPYGERQRDGRTFRLGQLWDWIDADRYRTTMIVEELEGDEWREVLRTSSDYYAITLGHLSHLILDAGFESCERSDVEF